MGPSPGNLLVQRRHTLGLPLYWVSSPNVPGYRLHEWLTFRNELLRQKLRKGWTLNLNCETVPIVILWLHLSSSDAAKGIIS